MGNRPVRALKAVTVRCTLLLSCLSAAALAAEAPQSGSEQQQWLLQQMRMGEALYRDDVVNDALARLELVAPQHPQVLLGKLVQALANPAANEAWINQLLRELDQKHPDSLQRRQAYALVRLRSQEGQQALQQARLLAAAGRFEEATKAFEQVLGEQPPNLAMALEYWGSRSRLNGQRPVAIKQLQALERDYPGNTGVRQMLASLLMADQRDGDALAVLHQLAGDPLASNSAAETEYNYLLKQPINPETLRAWQAFIGHYPYSPLIKDARQQLADQQRLQGDPAWQAGVQAKRLLEQEPATVSDSARAEQLLRRALKAYPQDPGLYGALGTALARQDKNADAYAAFTQALKLEQDTSYISKWQDLQNAARNWMVLQQGDQALARKDYAGARKAYQQARSLDAQSAGPLIGLAEVARGELNDIQAEALLLQARKLEPGNGNVIRALVRLYRTQSDERAVAFLNTLPASNQAEFAALRQSLELARMNQQADQFSQQSDWAQLVPLLKKIRVLDPDNPWLAYRLAAAEVALGNPRQADDAFAQLLVRQGNNPEARYAHGLYLANANRDSEVLASLGKIAKAGWTDNMRELATRIERRQLLARVEQLRNSGQEPQAIALLLRNPTLDDYATLADWATQRSDFPAAESAYRKVLAADPHNADAQLGLIEVLLATQRVPEARQALAGLSMPPQASANWQRRLANAWLGAGDKARAQALLADLLKTPQSDPLIYRDAARLQAKDNPQQALDRYAQAMAAAGLIRPDEASPRNNVALTRASRAQDSDDWLPRGLRSDVEELYKAQNTTVNVYRDFTVRTDSTSPGISDLTTQTTIVRVDTPVAQGHGFIQAEQADLKASDFETENGVHTEAFGTCAVRVRDRATGELVTNGCRSTSQSVSGPSLAVGWKNDQVAVDIGHTPQGFEVGNWLGGVAYSGAWKSVGWTVTASRRPLTNSVISYAGAVDPATGIRWGGVTSNGFTLSLSHDEGGVDGLWASLGTHWLRGKNVVDNYRLSAMAGYYYRLRDSADERMRTGLTLMYWGYDKDLSEYTLGQGGYYSPQQYYSIGVPLSYAWRNANWSAQVEGSVGWSFSSTESSDLYPLDGPAGKLFAQQASNGLDIDADTTLSKSGSSSTGASVRMQAQVERRLSNNLMLGTGVSLQHSEGYAPSRAMLYLRYNFDEWQGNLPMPIEPVSPYADMR
ncbi:cellulose synthase [Pseudomonas sp. Leaf127]|uniref:cellulose synthase complex outer membrane protein BcsC n=1 Tax=Pseudomonas sp. Leaf127 TaxID=1736267 RepID=UPI000702FF80|nr:cellulose synthase complex outer membrane protein BcsC [Pseudomonas sp. Leaf127]KQQ65537.1 cellulose synthase [Pseudomonas sp. Leaf127]